MQNIKIWIAYIVSIFLLIFIVTLGPTGFVVLYFDGVIVLGLGFSYRGVSFCARYA